MSEAAFPQSVTIPALSFADQCNQTAKPFSWKYTSAEKPRDKPNPARSRSLALDEHSGLPAKSRTPGAHRARGGSNMGTIGTVIIIVVISIPVLVL
jgi:hypothetical protein